MKTQTYYKVVSKNLKSATPIAKYLGLETQYIVNEWVKPHVKQAPLMVFDDIISARIFTSTNRLYRPFKIFECSIKESKRKWGWLETWNCERFFKALKHKKAWRYLVDNTESFPNGTVFADEVMLTKEIL